MTEHKWWKQVDPMLQSENRDQTGDEMLHTLLDIEGVDEAVPGDASRSQLDQLCVKTFRTILHKNDPRWRLVYQMQRVKTEDLLHGPHIEHALRADYLSDHPSIRRGYSRYIDQVTIPQLARALANIETGNKVESRFTNLLPLSDMYSCIYTAGSILADKSTGITGCQEALWQLQLYETHTPKETFLGRIGFNFHREHNTKVVSITNIQGAPNSPDAHELFEDLSGHTFGEYLVHVLQRQLRDDFVLRGVNNRPENKALYRSVFRHVGIPMYPVKRFTDEPYVPDFEDLFDINE